MTRTLVTARLDLHRLPPIPRAGGACATVCCVCLLMFCWERGESPPESGRSGLERTTPSGTRGTGGRQHHQPAEQVARGAPAQAGSGLGLRLDAERDPAVRVAALGGLVAADGTVRPIPARLEASGVGLLLDEVGADGLGAGEGEAAVELGASAAVGVPLHQDRALVGVRP